MQYISHYHSPLGDILLAADSAGLTGLWFEGQKYFALYLDKEHEEKELPVFEEAKRWLDIYFSGKNPDFQVPLHFTGTDFQNEVWEILYAIPTDRPRPTGKSPHSWQKNAACPACRPRPWAAPSGIMKSPSSCPVTGSWEPAEV